MYTQHTEIFPSKIWGTLIHTEAEWVQLKLVDGVNRSFDLLINRYRKHFEATELEIPALLESAPAFVWCLNIQLRVQLYVHTKLFVLMCFCQERTTLHYYHLTLRPALSRSAGC